MKNEQAGDLVTSIFSFSSNVLKFLLPPPFVSGFYFYKNVVLLVDRVIGYYSEQMYWQFL